MNTGMGAVVVVGTGVAGTGVAGTGVVGAGVGAVGGTGAGAVSGVAEGAVVRAQRRLAEKTVLAQAAAVVAMVPMAGKPFETVAVAVMVALTVPVAPTHEAGMAAGAMSEDDI